MNGRDLTLASLAALAAAGASRLGSRARFPDPGADVVDAATVRAAMYRSSRKHAGTGRDARLAEREVPDFDQLVWTLEDVRPGDDRLCQVAGCSERDVAAYARRMERGEVPPPVVLVARDGDKGFECVDGSHRIEAAQRADLETIPAYVGRPAKHVRGLAAASRVGSRSSIASNEHLDYVLLPRGKTAQIGAESGPTPKDGIARWTSPHGSVRYVRIVRGEPVAAIQVVVRGQAAHVAVAFTRKDQRRRGYGRELLAAIRGDYPDLTLSEDRSDDGRAFVQAQQALRKGSRVREAPAHDYLPLATIERHVPAMQRLGVSEVARSPRGFLAAYRAAGGDASALSPTWRAKREGFIARHMAQVRERSESLVDAQGRPTRRHLALIAWAYSPFLQATGSLAREPYLDYGTMTARELATQRTLQERGIDRRRATIARYEAEAARDTTPLGRKVHLDLADRERGPLAWHEEELGYLEAQQKRRGPKSTELGSRSVDGGRSVEDIVRSAIQFSEQMGRGCVVYVCATRVQGEAIRSGIEGSGREVEYLYFDGSESVADAAYRLNSSVDLLNAYGVTTVVAVPRSVTFYPDYTTRAKVSGMVSE